MRANSSRTRSLFSLVMLGLLTVAAAPAGAQNGSYTWNPYGAPAPPEVTFRYSPNWTAVPGTRVYTIRAGERPDYDMFRYGGTYYIYNNGYWYSAPTWNGRFVAMSSGSIPVEISSVPRRYWMSYPQDWASRESDSGWSNGTVQAPPTVDLRYAPTWVMIPGTNVYGIRAGEGPDFDMFRYDGNYYIYANGNWYRSDRWNTRYVAVGDRNVPTDLRDVPRRYWISYPAQWTSSDYNGAYTSNGAPPAPRVIVRHHPRWVSVAGTNVYQIRRSERPNFDIFRFGSKYYVYNNGYWYRSSRVNGPYVAIDESSVPEDFYNVPRAQWRSYPPNWASNGSYNR